ncbi:MAG: AraC family transcriptional regulator [Lachnospiraceae bacterium]|nr:AraC family transcriptional regulator [Lachnospiraceae bacterium]
MKDSKTSTDRTMKNAEFEQYEKTGYLTEPYRIFHLRDCKEQKFDFHYHEFCKIIYFVDGRVDYKVEGKTYHLKPYDFVLVGANVIHKPEIDVTVPYERYIIYLSEGFLAAGNEKGECLRYCFDEAERLQNRVVHFAPESYEELVGCLIRMEQIGQQKEEYMSDMLLKSAFMEFMVLFNRNVIRQPKAYITTAAYHEKVIDVITYIQEHLSEEISVDVLAKQCYISKYYLMRQFKEATGYSIHQYINEKRVQAARRMILSGMPASQACYECGFRDYSTFARRFKMIVGRAPSKLE